MAAHGRVRWGVVHPTRVCQWGVRTPLAVCQWGVLDPAGVVSTPVGFASGVRCLLFSRLLLKRLNGVTYADIAFEAFRHVLNTFMFKHVLNRFMFKGF